MPSEHIARLKATYENGEDNIGKDFIRPCLKECTTYRRGTAFFSSSSLKAYADALNHIVEDKVRIEILCSPVITDEGLLRTLSDNLSEDERLNTIQKYQEHFIRKVITKFKEDPDNRSRERSALLAYLIANDLLVIKTAIRKSAGWPDPWPTEEEVDKFAQLYHVKRGYFVFQDGKKIAFDGSFNETDSGHKHNTETANVYKDWVDRDEFRARNIIEKVDRDWEQKNPDLHIRPLSKELIELIKASAPEKRPRITPTQTEPPKEISVVNDPQTDLTDQVRLRPYQTEALKKWAENSHKGILAMATGSGKTVTAIQAIADFKEINHEGFVIIVVPKINLALQWISELKNFGILSIAAFTGHDWLSRVNNLVFQSAIYKSTAVKPCIVAVIDTFKSDEFQNTLNNISKNSNPNNLIVVDECHHFNKSETITKLPASFNYRLGLSATPFNQYEEEPEARYLLGYFNNIVFEYSLADAIINGNLTPYNYFIVESFLDDSETEDYEKLDAKISKLVAISMSAKSSEDRKALNQAYADKNRLLGSVKDKLIKLDNLLATNGKKYFTLAYCGSSSDEDDEGNRVRHINRVSKIFFDRGWSVGQITSDESIKERQQTIEDLTNRHQNVIVSIRVLDEGIDIPCCQTAYILSSSKSNREFIQRRGRVLRKSPGKDHADIYDFVILGGSRNSQSIEKLVKEEFYRVNEFAKLAINKNSIFEKYNRNLAEYE
jgi:superfamily II DNA or RNA helicase